MISDGVALYTVPFYRFIESKSPDYLNGIFSKYPNFTFKNESYKFSELFYNKYCFREIGAETFERFEQIFKSKVNEIRIKYAAQIAAYLDNIEKMDARSVPNVDTVTTTEFLNPSTATVAQLKPVTVTQNKTENDFYFSNLTNAEIVKAVADLYNIYGDMLNEFETIFMGCV